MSSGYTENSDNWNFFFSCENRLHWQYEIWLLIFTVRGAFQVLRSPKEAFAAAMQSWRERCEKCVCLPGDYVEK